MILTDKAREQRNSYAREWRRRNPDRVREANRRYWETRAARDNGKAKSEAVHDGRDA